jgi:hypothetical protein
MKAIIKKTLMATIAAVGLWACDKDNGGVNSDATPVIRYVRLTAAESADSLLVKGFMGNYVAIIGDNLAGVSEVWFNDRQALTLNPTLISEHAIIVQIPTEMYDSVTDQIKLVTRKGKTCTHPFVTMPPAPLPQTMSPEYARAGDEVIIKGKNFYGDEVQVFFPGGIEAQVLSHNPTQIVAKVPAEAANSKGLLTVKSPYGSSRSVFIYRDDRGMIMDFDHTTVDCWGSFGTNAEFISDANSVSGDYVKVAGAVTNGNQMDGFDLYYWQNPEGSDAGFNPYRGSLVPDPTKYQLRFEANISDWKGPAMHFIFAPANSTNGPIWDNDYPRYFWEPFAETGTYSTDGKWITVSIPLSECHYKTYGSDAEKLPAKWEDFTVFFYAGNQLGQPCNPVFLFDNFRIVPIE